MDVTNHTVKSCSFYTGNKVDDYKSYDIISATSQMLGTGEDIPGLRFMLNTEPMASLPNTDQFSGRFSWCQAFWQNSCRHKADKGRKPDIHRCKNADTLQSGFYWKGKADREWKYHKSSHLAVQSFRIHRLHTPRTWGKDWKCTFRDIPVYQQPPWCIRPAEKHG